MKRILAVLMVLCVAGCPRPAPQQSNGELAPPAMTTATREAWPYPECAFCVRHIRATLKEPDSFDALSWDRFDFDTIRRLGHRRIPRNIDILATYRAKNDVGAWSIDTYHFVFDKVDGTLKLAEKVPHKH